LEVQIKHKTNKTISNGILINASALKYLTSDLEKNKKMPG